MAQRSKQCTSAPYTHDGVTPGFLAYAPPPLTPLPALLLLCLPLLTPTLTTTGSLPPPKITGLVIALFSCGGYSAGLLLLRYGTVRYGTVRYGTVLYNTVRYSTVRYDTVRTAICSHIRENTRQLSQSTRGVMGGPPVRFNAIRSH